MVTEKNHHPSPSHPPKTIEKSIEPTPSHSSPQGTSKTQKNNWSPLGTYRDSLTFMMSWDDVHR